MKSIHPLHTLATSCLALALAACSDSEGAAPDSETPGSGGTVNPGSGGSPGSGGGANPGSGGNVSTGAALIPNETGWVEGTENDFGIQGAWYSYNDCADSPSDCTANHVPPEGTFPVVDGKMCTSGATAAVATEAEFSAKWGAGIALDLNNSGGDNGMKLPYDADAAAVIGFSFTITGTAPGLRVNFTTPATSTGSHFKAPMVPGASSVLFSDAKQGSWVTPKVDIDTSQILAIQFQIPSAMGMAVAFDFCVENLAPIIE